MKNTLLECKIRPIRKRRDGGTVYWCIRHKADATAKYGRPATKCRYAHVEPIHGDATLCLKTDNFPGGVSVWGAVPPIYDTTGLPLDRGIHVHARIAKDGEKVIDETYRRVELESSRGTGVVHELDAIYFMASHVLGFETHFVSCTHCDEPHLDKDWFAVHAHKKHLCAGCGHTFSDVKRGIGNPASLIADALGIKHRKSVMAIEEIDLKQEDYPGGMRIWGSNNPIVGPMEYAPKQGVHLHAYDEQGNAVIDDTYGKVKIDGVPLDETHVRTLMAQSALPHIFDRVCAFKCPHCKKLHFSEGEFAYTPSATHFCVNCNLSFSAPPFQRKRNLISNPLIYYLTELTKFAVRSPRRHKLNLIPEYPSQPPVES